MHFPELNWGTARSFRLSRFLMGFGILAQSLTPDDGTKSGMRTS